MRRLKVCNQLLSILLSISLLFGLFPTPAFAVHYAPETLAAVPGVEQATITVDYNNDERSEGRIIYHKKGIKADSFNIVFLLDTSKQGTESYEAFRRMLHDNGLNYIYDFGAASTTRFITYQNEVMVDTGMIGDKRDAYQFNPPLSGQGTAREDVALAAAVKAWMKHIEKIITLR